LNRAILFGVGVWAIWATAISAEDHLLVVGGGPSPQTNQISIEQNVLFLRDMLRSIDRSDLQPAVFFAAGDTGLPDVCLQSGESLPEAFRLLASILGDSKNIQLTYRCHDVGPVDGPADRQTILDAIKAQAKSLQAGDRLILYVTGHGGKGDPLSNGYIHTWNDGELRVRELAQALDALDPKVDVLLVMVQCYSGTFANLIFEAGDAKKGVSRHRRAGFFATVDSRPAAGCTPDTKVENYRDYSTSFFAALGGKDRVGQPVEGVDLDGDHRITFAEAHAYTVVNASTIDVCYRTSDRFLEEHGRLDNKDERLLSTDIPLEDLRLKTDAVGGHMLQSLADELQLDIAHPIPDAEGRSQSLTAERRRSRSFIATLDNKQSRLLDDIKDSLIERWPFLSTAWHPQTVQLISSRPDEVIHAVQGHADYGDWQRLKSRLDQARAKDLDRERRWAKVQRFLLIAKGIVRAENFAREADDELKAAYQQILDLESQTLARSPTDAVQTSSSN
jgi:hypothetical protein